MVKKYSDYIKEDVSSPDEQYFLLVEIKEGIEYDDGLPMQPAIRKNWSNLFLGTAEELYKQGMTEFTKYAFTDGDDDLADEWRHEWSEGTGFNVDDIEINKYVIMSIIQKVGADVDYQIKE